MTVADIADYPGSKWLKFDFHTHTPASDDYGRGNASHKDTIPEEWLRKAMEAGLDCVVVTDHNTGAWIDTLKAENAELQATNPKPLWYRELTIFPGVEITVGNSNSRVHLLAVFAPECNSQTVTAVLGACGITSGHGNTDISTKSSFIDTVKNIKQAGGIAIPAHIDGAQGLLYSVHTLSDELEKSFKYFYAAEFCDINAFDNVNKDLKKAVKRFAKVGGSDAHTPEEIGKHFSWCKMSTPSLEGLRLALQDQEFCIKNQPDDPNHLPDIFLSQLTIRDMLYCGRISDRPFVARLHPHFTAIIGGRGTGKSTLLEAIRIACRCDQNLADESPNTKKTLDCFKELSKNNGVMLSTTEILLELHRRGKKYQLQWQYPDKYRVLKEEINNSWQEVEAGNIREWLDISIFSQKQINDLASNPKALLDIIDRSPEVGGTEWKTRWETNKSRFLQLREHLRELERRLANEQQIRIQLADVENDLQQYEEKGHGEILKEYQKRSRQKNSLPEDQIFEDLSSGIRRLASNAGLSDFPSHVFDPQDETTAEIAAIHEQSAQELTHIAEMLIQVADKVDALKIQRSTNIKTSKWYQALQTSIAKYENLVKEYEEKNSPFSISLYGQWVQQRNQLQHHLANLDAIKKEAESTQREIADASTAFVELRSELLEKRRKFIYSIIGTNPFVRMELIPYGEVGSLEDDYRSLLHLEEGKFVGPILDSENKQGLLWALKNWEEAKTPETNLPQLIIQIKNRTREIACGSAPDVHATFANRLKKIFEKQPAAFDQLDAWWPEDKLIVKYSKDVSSTKFYDVQQGSAGQKAAAILAFLLSYGNGPLVIDQPEDDLDNALIYDLIVRQIHENKNRRQLIVVTHNPNIVVNGDAGLVHSLKFDMGQIQTDRQGGLEEKAIREAICDIMEGGRQAFEKRYKRITLEV